MTTLSSPPKWTSGTSGSYQNYNINFKYNSNSSGGGGGITAAQLSRSRSGGCNESKKHNNEEKAFYHGLKNAYRMGQTYDGTEYGSRNPQYEHAARVAAHVALAYLKTEDVTYDREESHQYIKDQGFVDEGKSVFRSMAGIVIDYDQPLKGDAFEAAIKKAWYQVDTKWNHDDAARTALAIAEIFLDEEFEV